MKQTWTSTGWSAALIVLLTALAYVPALRGGFVFDDYVLITRNRIVKAGDGLSRLWFTTEATDYYPLSGSLWWLEWHLWNDRATGYHVVNVLLHAGCAVLVWLILRRLKIPAAWLAAMVFAVHPVNVATGAWISEQKNTLSMLFYALAILLFLRFDEEGQSRWYGLSLGAFLLALLSKTAVVMLPVVLLGCLWWEHGRVRRRDWLCSVPFFVLSLVSGLVTIRLQYDHAMEGHAVQTGGFASRLAAAGWVPWFYLSKALVPIDLTVIYPKWEIDASRWVSYVPGIILIGGLALFWWKRKSWGRPWLFGLGYFVVTLFPVLGFFDQAFYRYSLVADHWQYSSIIGVIALAVAVGHKVGNRMGERGRFDRVLAGAAVLILLGQATWRRSSVYADSETLWRDNVTKNPYAWMAHNGLGSALEAAGQLDEAIEQYDQAVRINPDYAEGHYNLGSALWQAGKSEDAIEHYEEALQIKTNFAEAHYNLGIALWQTRGAQEALKHFNEAVRINPDYAEAHNNLGVALQQAGQVQEAIGQYERAVQIKPDYLEAHNNLAVALERMGRIQEAIGQYEEVIRLKPDFAEARNELTRLRAAR